MLFDQRLVSGVDVLLEIRAIALLVPWERGRDLGELEVLVDKLRPVLIQKIANQ
jgi:hypothetical protein